MKRREDPRVVQNTLSVTALRDYLREVINNPGEYFEDDNFRKALNSQGAISKLRDQERGINPSSKNTIERIANKSLEGGFVALDRLRLGAIEAIDSYRNRAGKSDKITKQGLLKRVNELEMENLRLRQDLLLHTLVLNKSLTQSANYVSSSGNALLVSLCEREQRELRDMLSLRETVVSPSKEGTTHEKEEALRVDG